MAILGATSKPRTPTMGQETYKVLNDQSVDETTSDAIDCQFARSVSLVVEAGAGVSSGVVKLEGAQTSDYAGT